MMIRENQAESILLSPSRPWEKCIKLDVFLISSSSGQVASSSSSSWRWVKSLEIRNSKHLEDNYYTRGHLKCKIKLVLMMIGEVISSSFLRTGCKYFLQPYTCVLVLLFTWHRLSVIRGETCFTLHRIICLQVDYYYCKLSSSTVNHVVYLDVE